MPCTNCTPQPAASFPASYFNTPPLACDPACEGVTTSTRCVGYQGANLPCSGIQNGDMLETVISKLDQRLCTATGDYSTYPVSCLSSTPFLSEAAFVSAISTQFCSLKGTVATFLGTTFPAYQQGINTRITALERPGITCAAAGVTPADSLQSVLNKYCTALGAADLSSVTWNRCFSVTTPPLTVAGGFNLVLDQICQIKTGSASLPTFNNVGSCLSSPTTTDSLVDTVNKIKIRLCSLPTLDTAALSSSCVTPGISLQSVLQGILTRVDSLSQAQVSFGPDFHVRANNSTDPCSGKIISLASNARSTDRLVGANASDAAPGTLMDKLVGVGITVDDTSHPGQVTLTTAPTYKVKADSADTSPDYLDQKLGGGTDKGITITPQYNPLTQKVDILPTVNLAALANYLLQIIQTDSNLKDIFCALVKSCPAGCTVPSTAQVTLQ